MSFNKRKRGVHLLRVLCALFPSVVFGDQFDGFKQNVTKAALKPFVKDIGGLLGSGTFHTGRSLGFPGVDIGGHIMGQSRPSADNTIIREKNTGKVVKNIVIPAIQGEIGLPYNFDFVVRGISYEEFAMVGGGLRYGLFKAKLVPLAPALTVSVFTHVLAHDSFTVAHVAGNVAFDLDIPFINPYIGVGADSARVKVKQATDASLVGLTAKESGLRGVAGINFKPLPLLYISGGYSRLHGQDGFEAGMGLKF